MGLRLVFEGEVCCPDHVRDEGAKAVPTDAFRSLSSSPLEAGETIVGTYFHNPFDPLTLE